MRSNLENNLARKLHLLSPTHEVLEAELDGSFLVPDDGPMFLFLDPGISDRMVFLPEIPPQGGLEFIVANISDTRDLLVVDANGVSITTVQEGQIGIFMCSYTQWKSLIGLIGEQNDFLTSLMDDVRVVAGDFIVDADETGIAIQAVAPTATAGSLPTVVGRNGRPISIVDWSSGIVADHIITLTPSGAETIMQQPTWTLASNSANLAAILLWPSETLNGWYIRP